MSYKKAEIERILKINDDLKTAFRELIFSLAKISEAISFNFNIDDVLKLLIDISEEFVSAQSAILFLYSENGYEVKLKKNTRGDIEHVLLSHAEEGLFEWVVKNKKPIVLPEERLGGAAIIVPLISYDEIMGVLDLFTRKQEEDITTQDLELLSIISAQGAIAIKNALLYKEMEEKNEKLDSMKTYMTDIIENLNDAIVVLSLEGQITALNKSAQNLFSVLPEESLGKGINEIFSEDLAEEFKAALKDTLSSGSVTDREFYGNIRSGITIPVSVNSVIFKSKENPGIIFTCRDITESKEIKRLKEIDRLKSELISNVSHELRTPLSSICAYTETLIDIIDDDDRETKIEFLSVIKRESSRLTDFINDLLDLSAIEAEKVTLKIAEIDVYPLIEQCFSVVNKLATEKEIRLNCAINPDTVFINADKNRIFQVFLNLVTNAVKYNRQSGTVDILAGESDDCVRIIIKDTGIGIEAQDIDKIFDKFFRVDNSITSEIGGTGLGLAIVHNIIKMHGGKIEVVSEREKGSSFIVTLPGEIRHAE